MARDLEGAVDGGGTTRASAAPAEATATTTVVQRGDAAFTVVPVPAAAASSSTPSNPPATKGAKGAKARVVRFTVETEGGIGADTGELAATVARVLRDPRGWQTRDTVRFVDVTAAEASAGAVDVRITLASPDTTDRLCAPLDTRGEVSCHNGGRVVLNLRRWLLGADAYGTDVAAYRTYLVNHEVGHALGHGHVTCPGKGQDAPVMMQQTYGLEGCVAWPWPTSRV
jgi:hypothetical protein